MAETIQVGGYEIQSSHSDKVFFPDAGITKGDLVEYYRRIAPSMLPHLRGRPLMMQRFPDGINASGFYQKQAPGYFPAWIDTVSVQVQGRENENMVVCGHAAGLVYLAEQGCITPHVWLSRRDRLHRPDRLIFDLDPAGRDFAPVRFAARALRKILTELGLTPFLMTTGSRGLHVVAPLDQSDAFDAVRTFARDLGRLLSARHPDRLTTETRKEKRRGRLFLDYLRNSYAQTTVAPYGVRALPGAPVAAPLDWGELGRGGLTAGSYTIRNIFRRLGQKADPWADINRHARSLDEPRKRLDDLLVKETNKID